MKSLKAKSFFYETVAISIISILIGNTVIATATAKPNPSPTPYLPPISTQPNELPVFTRERPSEPQECDRFFVYRDKKILCDSVIGKDGEPLRPILAQVPESILELEKYQERRRRLKTAAYFGSIGLALVITGLLAPRFSSDTETQKTIRRTGYLGGLGFMTATGLFGVIVLGSNESNLGNAVRIYNEHRPNDTIQLQFSTGILF